MSLLSDNMGDRTQEEINRQLINVPKPLSNKDLTRIILDQWRGSQPIEDMLEANEYYLVRNTAVAGKQRRYQDEYGSERVNESLSNVKIPSAFLRISVNQKVNYAFGKPFSISVEAIGKTPEEQKDDAIAKTYLQEWQNYINTYFRKTVKRIAKNAVNNGIGWAYVWIDEEGKLQVVDVDSHTLYPQWADRAHMKLDVIIRDFAVTQYIEDKAEEVQKVEYWDAETVERYLDRGEDLENDIEGEEFAELPVATAHMVTPSGDALGWGKVPFIALKSNEDELPLLNMVKELIDAYDELTSKTADSLMDDIDPVIVFRNLSSELGTLIKARELLKSSRIAAVDEHGDAYYLQVKSDIAAAQMKLESIRRDITKFASDVDYEDQRFGGNPNQLVIKAMFQNLDTYTNGLEVEFEVFMENLKYFFDRWLEFRNIGTVEQWEQYRLIVTLDRDLLINETSLIENTVKLLQTGASQETVDNYNPAVESHEVEQARRDEEYAENMEKQQEQMKMMEMAQFEQTVGGKQPEEE